MRASAWHRLWWRMPPDFSLWRPGRFVPPTGRAALLLPCHPPHRPVPVCPFSSRLLTCAPASSGEIPCTHHRCATTFPVVVASSPCPTAPLGCFVLSLTFSFRSRLRQFGTSRLGLKGQAASRASHPFTPRRFAYRLVPFISHRFPYKEKLYE